MGLKEFLSLKKREEKKFLRGTESNQDGPMSFMDPFTEYYNNNNNKGPEIRNIKFGRHFEQERQPTKIQLAKENGQRLLKADTRSHERPRMGKPSASKVQPTTMDAVRSKKASNGSETKKRAMVFTPGPAKDLKQAQVKKNYTFNEPISKLKTIDGPLDDIGARKNAKSMKKVQDNYKQKALTGTSSNKPKQAQTLSASQKKYRSQEIGPVDVVSHVKNSSKPSFSVGMQALWKGVCMVAYWLFLRVMSVGSPARDLSKMLGNSSKSQQHSAEIKKKGIGSSKLSSTAAILDSKLSVPSSGTMLIARMVMMLLIVYLYLFEMVKVVMLVGLVMYGQNGVEWILKVRREL